MAPQSIAREYSHALAVADADAAWVHSTLQGAASASLYGTYLDTRIISFRAVYMQNIARTINNIINDHYNGAQ